jgi:Skp family chaperone for outer membrane proteins
MNKLIRISAIAALMIATAPAFADQGEHRHHPHDPGVNARQHHQQERIEQGARSGELTRGEARQLRQEERGIRKEEREYKADGKLTKDERKDLHEDLNKVSKDIHDEKHDAEKR